MTFMLTQIYVNNYRCMQNFTMKFATSDMSLVMGLNGVGKSTLLSIFSKLQRLTFDGGQIEQVFGPEDFSFGDSSKPIRIELALEEGNHRYEFALAMELPVNFTKLRIFEEKLLVDGHAVYERSLGQVSFYRTGEAPARFIVDWHILALPIIQDDRGASTSIADFREILKRMVAISPVPQQIGSEIKNNGAFLQQDCGNFASWLNELQRKDFRIGQRIVSELQETIYPDLISYSTDFDKIKEKRVLSLIFGNENGGTATLDFANLSDGEKCMFICAAVTAQVEVLGCPLCLWDEPDNFMAISEVRSFVSGLRKSFRTGKGQLLVTSHNPEAIESVAPETVRVFLRDSHLEPLREKTLDELIRTPEAKKHLRLLLLTGRLYDEEA